MKKDDKVYLHHIIDAIGRIEVYTREVSKEEYLQDGLLQDGVVRQLEIIGEASTNISEEFQEKHSDIPWGQIIGLRNRIVHGDIPELKQQIERILF